MPPPFSSSSSSSSPPASSSRPSKSSKRNSASSSSSSRRELSFVPSKSNGPGHCKDLTVREKFCDTKENASTASMPSGRQNHNLLLQTPPKKPWAQHFSKVSITSSPNPRILVERNRPCSPSRSSSPKLSTDLSGKDEKRKPQAIVASPLEQKQQEILTPNGKSVAELSKRIQKFLVDQETQLAIAPAGNNEAASMAAADREKIQDSLSSPYDPYSSPFSERPQFLHLHGTVPSLETLEPQNNNTVIVSQLSEDNTDDGADVQSPVTDFLQEIEDGEIVEDKAGELSQPQEEAFLLLDGVIEEGTHSPVEENQTESVEEISSAQHGCSGIHLLMQKTEEPSKDENERSQENEETPVEETVRKYEVHMEDLIDNHAIGGTDDVQITVEGVEKRSYTRDIVYSVLLLSFLASVLMASGSSGLLPPSLRDNYISSVWHGSRFHHPSMVFLHNFEALWSEDQTYLAMDLRMAVEDGKSLYRSMKSVIGHKGQLYFRDARNIHGIAKTLFDQAIHEIHLHFELISHICTEWWKKTMDSEVSEGRTRQFEWVKEYNLPMDDGWIYEEEIPLTDWELLHEFDLQEANRLIRGSISDGVWNDLRKNITGLSDTAAVKGVLEGLMNLKGGRSEEDRMEVLHYFWEHALLSSIATGEEGYASLAAVEHVPHLHDGQLVEEEQEEGMLYEASESDNTIEITPQISSEKENVSEFHGPNAIYSTIPEDVTHTTLIAEAQCSNASDITIEDEGDLSKEGHLDVPKEDAHFEAFTAERDEATSTEEAMSSTNSLTSDGTMILSEEADAHTDNMPTMAENHDQNTFISQWSFFTKSAIAAAITSVFSIGATLLILGRKFKLFHGSAAKTAGKPQSNVQFLKRAQQQQDEQIMRESIARVEKHRKDISFASDLSSVKEATKSSKGVPRVRDGENVTMIEDLNGKFASLLQSPVPSSRQQRNSPRHVREDEELIRSPLPLSSSTHSPYGSFTTYALLSKKEGQTVEPKLTPVRRSSRLRNQELPSVQRIAISPP